jgi:RNA-directed DNA polymerase
MVAVGDVPLKDHGQGVMDLIASDAVLDEAYAWLCDRRKDYSAHDDVWTLRERWADVKPWLQKSLLRGEYRCDVTRRVRTEPENFSSFVRSTSVRRTSDINANQGLTSISGGSCTVQRVNYSQAHCGWRRRDLVGRGRFGFEGDGAGAAEGTRPGVVTRCFHLAGHGGLKGAVRAVDAARRDQTFVFRTDVHGYYASLDHGILYRQVREHVTDRRVLKLVWSYLRRMVCEGGEYEAVTRGISLGCPLSPLMGALYLKPLDDLMERLDLPYVRYMDDWVILAKTRWALRRVVQQVNTILDNLKLEKHPDKTFIGRIDRGFDFLGYRFVAEGVRLAAQTKQRFVERATRLYEQGAAASRIGEYVRHWLTWVRSGCLEHVWGELLVGIMRSSDVLVLVTGFWSHFQLSRSSGNRYASTS